MSKTTSAILAFGAAVFSVAGVCSGQDVAKAFGGKLLSYEGKVASVQYDFEDPSELKDWEGIETEGDSPAASINDGILTINAGERKFSRVLLEMPFSGDVTVEMKARVNPPRSREIIVYLYAPGGGYRTCAGYREKGESYAYVVKSPGELLKKQKTSDIEESTWCELRVKVEGRGIGVWVDGRLHVNASDDETRTGQVGVGTYWSSISVDWVKVTGVVDQTWLDTRLAAYAPSTTSSTGGFPGEERLLEQAGETARKAIESGKKWLDAGKYSQAAQEFRKAAEGADRSALGSYYLGRALLGAGELDEAEKALNRAISGSEDFAQAYLWRANLRMSKAPSFDQSMAFNDLRAAIRHSEGQPEMFEALALLECYRSDPESALAAAQKALRLREISGQAQEAIQAASSLRDAYLWAARGIPSQRPLRMSGPFGELVGDASLAKAQELIRWLGSVCSTMNLLTGSTPKNMRLVLLEDEKKGATYAFPGAMSPHASGAGYLNFARGEIVLRTWSGDAASYKAGASLTARGHCRMNGAAPWIEEGFATYFDIEPGAGGERPTIGAPNAQACASIKALLGRPGTPSAADLVKMSRGAVSRDSGLCALSYGLVHYMLHGQGGKRDYFREYFKGLSERAADPAAGSVDWEGIQSSFVEHLKRISG